MLDSQQLRTTLVDRPRISQRMLVTVASYHPRRGTHGLDDETRGQDLRRTRA